MRSINLIVIHCSAVPNGRPQTTADINGWHHALGMRRTAEFMARQNEALDAIGYHFIILLNGAVATGRHIDEVGDHVRGRDQKSIGICLIGTDQFTLAQWSSLRYNVTLLRAAYPEARVVGHRDIPHAHKTSPGFDVTAWLAGDMAPPAGHVLP